MAEILEDYEFIKRGGFHTKYPWDLWLNGQVWKLVEGIDYKCSSASIRASAGGAARTRKLTVHTNMILEGKGIVLQAEGEV